MKESVFHLQQNNNSNHINHNSSSNNNIVRALLHPNLHHVIYIDTTQLHIHYFHRLPADCLQNHKNKRHPVIMLLRAGMPVLISITSHATIVLAADLLYQHHSSSTTRTNSNNNNSDKVHHQLFTNTSNHNHQHQHWTLKITP